MTRLRREAVQGAVQGGRARTQTQTLDYQHHLPDTQGVQALVHSKIPDIRVPTWSHVDILESSGVFLGTLPSVIFRECEAFTKAFRVQFELSVDPRPLAQPSPRQCSRDNS